MSFIILSRTIWQGSPFHSCTTSQMQSDFFFPSLHPKNKEISFHSLCFILKKTKCTQDPALQKVWRDARDSVEVSAKQDKWAFNNISLFENVSPSALPILGTNIPISVYYFEGEENVCGIAHRGTVKEKRDVASHQKCVHKCCDYRLSNNHSDKRAPTVFCLNTTRFRLYWSFMWTCRNV